MKNRPIPSMAWNSWAVPANPQDEMRVAFPANARFAPVGRVATAGLALRLGFDVAQVENLRLAVNTAINALSGDGEVSLTATWTDDRLRVELVNPDASGIAGDTGEAVVPEALVDELARLVADVSVSSTQISLGIG